MKTLGKSILFVSALLAATSSIAQNNEHKHEGASKSDMHQGMAMSHENMGEMHKKMMENMMPQMKEKMTEMKGKKQNHSHSH